MNRLPFTVKIVVTIVLGAKHECRYRYSAKSPNFVKTSLS